MGPVTQVQTQFLNYLIAERDRLRRARWAPNTELNYAYDWAAFSKWCIQVERPPLPSTTETLSLYLASMLARGLRVSTATRSASAIAHFHRLNNYQPPNTGEIYELLNAAQRMRGEQPRKKRALTLDQLRAIAAKLGRDGTPKSIRDRAILVVGFASALRRSNIVALALEHIEFTADGIIIRIMREKQDQEGRGRLIGVPVGAHAGTCPVRCLRAWLQIRGAAPGPLFTVISTLHSLRAQRIADIVKRGVSLIGLDPSNYGAHSLRSGFVTAAAEAGAGELLIASQTGHRDMQVLRGYFQRGNVFRSNACAVLKL